MKNLNEHVNRMKQLFNAQHGVIKPLVSEQSNDDFDDLISKSSKSKPLSSTPPNQNSQNTPENKPQTTSQKSNDSNEDDDMMVNKPGSGKNVISSIAINIKNTTKNTNETIMSSFREDNFSSEYDMATVSPELQKLGDSNYGYSAYVELNKNKYSFGDSVNITFSVPFILGKVIKSTNDSINNINTSVSGGKTNVTIYGKITEDKNRINTIGSISAIFKVDESNPFGGDKNLRVVIS